MYRILTLWGCCGVLLIAFLSASGCTTLTPEQQAQLQKDASMKITCMKGDDCDMRWGRAIAWISQNSRWKIQSESDFLIQTYTSSRSSTASSFVLNKVPMGNDMFEINMTSGCANWLGCTPNATELKATFNRFVAGTVAQK
jgi:hypothetical protein